MMHIPPARLFVAIITVTLIVMHSPVAEADGAAKLTVEKPWARASIMLSRPSVAYLTIINRTAAPDRMLSASTPAAGRVLIHELRNSGGVISMQHQDELLIPAGQSVQLKPGGLHLMLMNLNKMLREGETFELSLRFERAGVISVRVPVLGLRARAPH